MFDAMKKKALVSFTGGKDCHLALMKASENFDVVGLVCFHAPPEPQFQTHPWALQKLQAMAIGLPLYLAPIDAVNGDYVQAYRQAIVRLHEERDITVLVTGDVDLIGNATTHFMTKACEGTSVVCYNPLWKMSRIDVVTEEIRSGLTIRFSCVKSPHFDSSWIGKVLDDEAIVQMQTKEGLDLCGENGEYHTMVTDGPMYIHGKLVLRNSVYIAKELKNQPGQKDYERWWVLEPDAYILQKKGVVE
jgi:diphthine-ammonia ligase